MFTKRGRRPGVVLGVLLVGSLALLSCGARAESAARSGAGCAEALAARGEALASVDASTKIAAEKNAARAAQLEGIAKEAADELARAVDLTPCEDDSDETGVIVDLADLRARYSVVLERTQTRLDATAAQPVTAPAGNRAKGTKGKSKGGTKGD